ncbi:MAG TPA: hypothetical protein VNW92_11050, partial [Polyangiaceae bacterium]|nr:hypothetical protein [Polyangiaceae bacterium]
SGGRGSASAGPCQPLTPITSPVTIAASDIVDAGRDSDGTEYVLLSDLRLFVSNGAILVEENEHGAGSGENSGTQFWTFQYLDEQGMPVTVEVQKDAAGLRMGVVKGPIPGKGFDVGSVGDVLEPVDPALAAAMSAQATQTFHVEFAGLEADGVTWLVVTAPDHEASGFDGFRVFIGPVGALAEQAGPVMAGRSSETELSFTSNGSPAQLFYGLNNGTSGGGTLTVGKESQMLSSDANPVLPTGAVFLCR